VEIFNKSMLKKLIGNPQQNKCNILFYTRVTKKLQHELLIKNNPNDHSNIEPEKKKSHISLLPLPIAIMRGNKSSNGERSIFNKYTRTT